MTIYANATCGFLPLHLYEGLELERALTIVHAINTFALDGIGLAHADPKPLADLSLQEMLDAVRIVERYNERPRMLGVGNSLTMVPADRLIAAVYTLINFYNPSAHDGDDGDDIPVRFTARRWGDETVHFLLIGARPKQTLEDDKTEERVA